MKALGKPPEKQNEQTIYLRHEHFKQALLEAADYIQQFGGEKVMRINEQVRLWRMLRMSAGKERAKT